MKAELVLQILGSGAVAAVLFAIVNGFFSRRKLSSEATEVITRAASGVVERLEAENLRILGDTTVLMSRLHKLEQASAKQNELLEAHVAWDRRTVAALRQAGIEHVTNPPPLVPEEDR